MPRIAIEDNSRMSLRIRLRTNLCCCARWRLKHTDLTDFVIHHAVNAAKAVIEEADHLRLSERDSLRCSIAGESACAERETAGSRPGVAEAAIIVTAWHEEPILF